jgi:hypothetical protein
MPPIPPAGRRRPLWQTLLLSAGLLFLAFALSADDCTKTNLQITTSTGQSRSAYTKKVRSGVRQEQAGRAYNTHIRAKFHDPTAEYPTAVTVIFTPPEGARDISFDRPPAGRNPDGSYYWKLGDPDGIPGIDIVADYTVAGDPLMVIATATVIDETTHEETSSSHIVRPQQGGGGAVSGSTAGAATAGRPDEDDYYLWQVHPHFWTADLPLTQGLCQDLLDLLQSPDFFVAVRVPIYPPGLSYTEPYTLPVVFQAEISPTLSLVDRTARPHVTLRNLPLEYRPELFTFLESELPAASDAHWLALGAAADPPASCAGLPELPADGWYLRGSLDLDLGGAKGDYTGRTLLVYYCYRGQDPPFFFQTLGDAAGGVTSYQGWGITAFGPAPVHLVDDADPPPFEIVWPHAALITPTTTISLSHAVWNRSPAPQTVDVEFQGTLGLPWALYADKGGTQPLPKPARLTLPPWSGTNLYLVAAVPPDAPSGMEALILTATGAYSPTLTTWTSDLLWVGEWRPPPLPPGKRVYLPLVTRNR